MVFNKNTFFTGLCITFFLTPLSLAKNATEPTYNPIIKIQILGINDFHGQINSGRLENGKPIGGAAVLAAYLKNAQAGMEDRTIITIMGDQVGASPPASALLNDEPTILFTNSLANHYCSPAQRMHPLCNVVATIGNHEFDKGQQAMMDLIYGSGNPPTFSWIPLAQYPGANYPFISANIIKANAPNPLLFPPYVIKSIHNIRIAFIGALLKNAETTMFPAHAQGLTFLDEAEQINHYLPEIKAKGAKIIIVLLHEGGNQTPYAGKTRANSEVNGRIKKIITQLDDGVDVVMAGHTHQFLNAQLPNHRGKKILLTQAHSYGTAFAQVTLLFHKKKQRVIYKSAQIIKTLANRWPGSLPDSSTLQLVQLAEDKVLPIISSYVGFAQHHIPAQENLDGESALGNLVTDAFRLTLNTDIALYNLHGLRDNLNAGIINKGMIYSVLPFANNVVVVTLSGHDLYNLLEQQWNGAYPNMLQISGLSYTYDAKNNPGHKIINLLHLNQPIIREKIYTIATSDFLASGAGIFSVLKNSHLIQIGSSDSETVINYLKNLPQPFSVTIEGRIKNNSSPLLATKRLAKSTSD
ncbi:MAG: bifunctional metallophosphatase/5'-nucleotidase [bacterium]|nr:bifunctional metallophosphatase/5'-nucleotidase [bacterium]